MRTAELNIDDGLVAYSVNGGKATITFNPTDASFFKRLYDAFSKLSAMQDSVNEKHVEDAPEKVYEVLNEISAQMKAQLDETLAPFCNVPSICEAVYGGMNLWAYSCGVPVWCNLVLSLIDTAEGAAAEQKTLSKTAMEKYTKKYHR